MIVSRGETNIGTFKIGQREINKAQEPMFGRAKFYTNYFQIIC
jgi:hypothetical protein